MSAGLLRPHLGRWSFGAETDLRLLHLSENATYLARDADRALVLRLHRHGYHSAEEIRSELAWLTALQEEDGLACCRPVAGRDGAFLQTVELDGLTRHLVAYELADGDEPDCGDDLSALFGDLGAITARLHAHARAWPRPSGFVRKCWDLATILGPRPHWGRWQDASGLDSEEREVLRRLAETLHARLAAYGAGPARCGLIHADLRLANLLAHEGRLRVIDFDDCGFSWWMYDFAASVSFMEDDHRVPELAAAWEEGYRTAGVLSPEDRAVLPTLVLLRRLLLLAWVASRATSEPASALGASFAPRTAELAARYLAAPYGRFWSA